MTYILARPAPSREPTRRERLLKQAEDLLDAAADDYLRSVRSIERAIRLAHKYGVSERGISKRTGIARSRIHQILTAEPEPSETVED